jgi:hypothetical protein
MQRLSSLGPFERERERGVVLEDYVEFGKWLVASKAVDNTTDVNFLDSPEDCVVYDHPKLVTLEHMLVALFLNPLLNQEVHRFLPPGW